MNTQLWMADFVPKQFPEFLNPRYTCDYFGGKHVYVFELYVNHPFFARCKSPDNKAKKYLRYCGFISPKRIYQGLCSEVFLNGDDFSPRPSNLLFGHISYLYRDD